MPAAAGGTAKQVEDESFYHGFMSNDECKPLLTNPGDFLLRRAEVGGEMQYVITVLPENSNELANFVIKRTHTVSKTELIQLISIQYIFIIILSF